MLGDLKYIILWWLVYLILGWISLPLAFKLFKNFWDKGYIFTKTISLAILTYVIFVMGVFKVIPFTNPSLFVLIIVGIIADLFYLSYANNYREFFKTFNSKRNIFIFEEVMFLLILIAWSFVRGFAPDIEGLEKYMDWGFVNSALRSQFMPPADMWYAGSSINYYYFGHLMVAVLTKLSNISSTITYNLAIASTCAITFVSGFSFASNLVASATKKINLKNIIVGGLFSALLLTFGGNLHVIYKIAKIDMENNHGKLVLTRSALNTAASTYWYPDATRFIGFDPDVNDKTIHEFPLYSFVVADLHGHMNDIPIVILFCTLLLAVSTASVAGGINWLLVAPAGFLLSLAFMTNAWDFAVYGLVFAVSSFIRDSYFINLKSSFINTFKHGLLIILFWYLFTLPFSLDFTPMADGLRLADAHSPFYQLFVLYGGFWLICLPFLLRITYSVLRKVKVSSTDLFVFSLILVATILIIIPEIGYIKDIYIYEHRRANTMFKLVYQAFMLYCLVSGYILIKFKKNVLYKILFGTIFVCQMIYPYFAIKSYYGLTDYKGLYGLNYLKQQYPDNFIAISWINQNISGQPVMLEAVGDSYTTFEQVSSATGLPTVEGWIVHEWLWRGGYDKPAARQTDVQKIYESKDINEAKSLLQKYSVQYIFVGDKEREKYPNINEKTFTDLGAKVIFSSGQTRIYKLN